MRRDSQLRGRHGAVRTDFSARVVLEWIDERVRIRIALVESAKDVHRVVAEALLLALADTAEESARG